MSGVERLQIFAILASFLWGNLKDVWYSKAQKMLKFTFNVLIQQQKVLLKSIVSQWSFYSVKHKCYSLTSMIYYLNLRGLEWSLDLQLGFSNPHFPSIKWGLEYLEGTRHELWIDCDRLHYNVISGHTENRFRMTMTWRLILKCWFTKGLFLKIMRRQMDREIIGSCLR